MTSSPRSKAVLALAGVLVLAGLGGSLTFTRSTGNLPWFDQRLEIDGGSYVLSLHEMQQGAGWLELSDLYHSPGYQLYVRAFLKLGGNSNLPRRIKSAAWLLGALSVALTFFLGERAFGSHAGALAAVLLAFSVKWTAYMNLLQYEVPLAFLLVLLASLLPFALSLLERRQAAAATAAGLCAAGACFLHFRMLLLLPLGAASLWLAFPKKAARLLVFFLFPPVVSVSCWSAYQTLRLGDACLVQQLRPWADQVRLHNHAAALGYPLPYIEPSGPSGISFILSRPGRYLWLVKERFLYTWDIKKDLWYIGPEPGGRERTLHLMALALFLAGAALKAREDRRRGAWRENLLLYALPALPLAGLALSPGSSRYLVPVLPFVCLFQAYAFTRAASGAIILLGGRRLISSLRR